MKRQTYFFLSLFCLICLSGCTISFSAKPLNDTNSSKESSSQAPFVEEGAIKEVASTINQTIRLEKSITTQLSNEQETSQDSSFEAEATPLTIPDEKELFSLYSLDNTIQNWGYSTKDRDSDNRPNGCIQFQNRYTNYSADFLGENTPIIYLTFDEGYENGYTGQILDILKEKNVSAVFFVTMPYVKENPDLIQRMIDEGHIVGNHSVTHPESGFPSLSLQKQAAEIVELHNYILENFHYNMKLFRYPKGMFSEQSLALLQKMGYRSIFWSFAYRDWVTTDQPSQQEGLNKTIDQLHPGAIYLLHAVSSTNTSILPQFIDKIRESGYEFGIYQ